MNKKKLFTAFISLVLVIAMVLPGTMAVSNAADSGSGTVSVSSGAEEPAAASQPAASAEDKSGTAAYAALLEQLLETTTAGEFDAAVKALSEEELAGFQTWLADSGRDAELEAHYTALLAQLPPAETKVFTDAGPFMPAVTVGASAMQARRAPANNSNAQDDNGVTLHKSAKDNGDGTYTITLESYTTGEVTTVTKTTPVDVVLVLDQSGSMADDFSGNSTSSNQNRRQYAMKQAVNNFIDEVNKKYDAEADHRVAIVTFGTDASTLQPWTYADAAGKDTLTRAINGLPNQPSGATNAGAGMQAAETLMGSGYSYTGQNTQRQKVVILFTDGVPTTGTRFDVGTANAAITAAKNMKDAGITVYSVGIFNGANPDQLYGNCGGKVGDKWGKRGFIFVGGVADADQPAGNRFMNYVSSNFGDTTEIGLKSADWWEDVVFHCKGWEITKNFDRTASNYYLTANDSESLNKIFKTISQNIGTPSIQLDAQTVIQDVIGDSFELPQGADENSIQVYTADATAESLTRDRWEQRVPSDLKPTLSDRTIRVSGFDYNENFVAEKPKGNGSYGKKLIVEFTVRLREGFLGGSSVPTNGTSSGIYHEDGTVIERFDVPRVDVPVGEVQVEAADRNVYLLGSPTADQLISGTGVTVGGVALDLSKADYGLEPWQTAYVNIAAVVTDAAESGGLAGLKDDTTYNVTVSVTSGSDHSQSDSDSANIYVFKPQLTFRDSTAFYGEAIPESNNYSGNMVGSAVWKHGETLAENVTMLGNQPSLDVSYTPDASRVADGKYTKQDVPVTAAVKIGGEDVTECTAFLHQNCDTDCGWTDSAFMIHIRTGQLSITKSGGTEGETFVFLVYKDGEFYSEVSIQGNGTQTLYELPAGTYTVKEELGWSWRYDDVEYSDRPVLSAQEDTGFVVCTNRQVSSSWLNGFSQIIRNIFGVNR